MSRARAEPAADARAFRKWYSVYDDTTVTNVTQATIDHMVPLAEAWRSGSDTRRPVPTGWARRRRTAGLVASRSLAPRSPTLTINMIGRTSPRSAPAGRDAEYEKSVNHDDHFSRERGSHDGSIHPIVRRYSRTASGELSALEDRVGALLDQKYEKLFSLLDVNGDGVIAEEDFELMAARVLTASSEERTAKGEKYADAMMNYWRALRETADADGDGRIDRDEFRQALRQVSVNFDTLVGPLYQAGFHLADRDDDGLVGKEDFVTVLAAIGVPATEAGATFDGLTEQDGQLTKDQLMTSAAQYYRNEEPAGTSSHLLFGAL